MIVDSSAVLAVLFREEDAERYEKAIAAAPNCRMSVANLLEVFVVVESRGGTAAGGLGARLDFGARRCNISSIPITSGVVRRRPQHVVGRAAFIARQRERP